MSDLIVVQPQVTELTVTEQVNQVTVASVGVQGAKGDTGATGATGATGSSGVVSVTAPITNSGTSTAANIGIDLANIALKYASPWQVKYRAGYWYEAKNGAQILNATYAINRMNLLPIFIQESITIDRIGGECFTAVASSTFRLGIYNSDSNGVPSSLLLDAGTIDTSTTGLKSITISQSLTAGLYYLAAAQQGGASSATMRAYHNVIGNHSPVASTSMSTTNYQTGYNQDSVSGAFPSTYTANNPNTLQQPRIQFRVA